MDSRRKESAGRKFGIFMRGFQLPDPPDRFRPIADYLVRHPDLSWQVSDVAANVLSDEMQNARTAIAEARWSNECPNDLTSYQCITASSFNILLV